ILLRKGWYLYLNAPPRVVDTTRECGGAKKGLSAPFRFWGAGRDVGVSRRGEMSATATQGQEMSGAEMVIQALADQGVRHIFGYPGGAVLPIYDALFQQDKVQHILVRHEQGAVHAAEGYARSPGKVGGGGGT